MIQPKAVITNVEFARVERAEELLGELGTLDQRLTELQPDYDAMIPEGSLEFMVTADKLGELAEEYEELTGGKLWYIEVESREAAKKAVLDQEATA